MGNTPIIQNRLVSKQLRSRSSALLMVMLTAVVAVLRHWFTSICAPSVFPFDWVANLLVRWILSVVRSWGSSRTMPPSLCVSSHYPNYSLAIERRRSSKKEPPFPFACTVSEAGCGFSFCSTTVSTCADSDFSFTRLMRRVVDRTARVCVLHDLPTRSAG